MTVAFSEGGRDEEQHGGCRGECERDRKSEGFVSFLFCNEKMKLNDCINIDREGNSHKLALILWKTLILV